jgi:hypothetical protein
MGLWELAEHMACHFEDFRRTAPATTMAMFVLPKWAKFNTITRHWKSYQEFLVRTHMFTRMSVADPTQREVVAPPPWSVQLLLVDVDHEF